jgi:putative hydrolase of the HAD superfamily
MQPTLRAILFDLDDTLFDHQHASGMALRTLHADKAPHVDFTEFSDAHAQLLEHYHQRFLAREYSLDEARALRMQALFARFDIALERAEAWDIGMAYRVLHQRNRQLVPGAADLLETLFCGHKLAIVTNNSGPDQREKLKVLGIEAYFSALSISEEVGHAKPAPDIFWHALDQLGIEPHEAVMVGDNLNTDVQGALDAGIACVWFNRTGAALPPQHSDLIQINSLAPAREVASAIALAHQQRSNLFKGVKHVLSALAS